MERGSKTSRHRLVVAIDYGTTYSGIAFVTTDKTNVEDINVIRTWPGKDGEWKAPTRIAYPFENPNAGLRGNAWGYQVEPGLTSCSWTKLLLDSNSQSVQHDDPNLKKAIDNGILRLPSGLSAQQVCEDYLREMNEHVMARLAKHMSKEVLQSTPMDCWLTVPAVWSDQAKNATKAAAVAAGFGSRAMDTISVIPEPEAAAIATLTKYAQPRELNALSVEEVVLICDCGGGTVDLTTYIIKETQPKLAFEELCVGIGGKCGATYVDRNLHDLMEERFGEAFQDVEMRRKGPNSRFMASFETVKRAFGGSGDYRVQEIGPLNMRGVADSEYYDEDEGMVKLTRSDVQGMFDPVVDEIIQLVKMQVMTVMEMYRKIDRLVLIGGFGDSEYLFTRLKNWCRANGGIKAYCPEHPQAAIVRGAALRGLQGIAPRLRRCRKHYGIVIMTPFRQGTDPEHKAMWDKWNGTKYCHRRVEWMIAKGEGVTEETKRQQSLGAEISAGEEAVRSVKLVSCTLAEAPEHAEHPDVQTVGVVKADFTTLDRDSFPSKLTSDGVGIWKFAFTVEVQFGAKSGLLAFQSLVKGKVAGTAEIAFD